MRRFRLPMRRTLFFLCAFLFALAALVPLRFAADWMGLPERGFAARDARGSVWLGGFRDAQYGAVQLGDMHARLNSLPLLLGRVRVALGQEGEEGLEGAATVTANAFGFDDLHGSLPAGATFAPLPVGTLDLDDVTARFSQGRCVEAAGLVRAGVSGGAAAMALPGGLSGNVRCDGDALLIPLASQSGMEQLSIRIRAGGAYVADLVVRPSDDGVRDQLIARGFQLGRGGYVMRVEGTL